MHLPELALHEGRRNFIALGEGEQRLAGNINFLVFRMQDHAQAHQAQRSTTRS